MREINGEKYKLMLIDTGAISELLKNKNNERNGLVKLIIDLHVIPCFSVVTLLELRRRPDLYLLFLEIFSLVPFFLIKLPEMLFAEELDNYPNPSGIDPIGFVFSFASKNPLAQLKNFMEKLFSNPNVLETERAWNMGWKKEGLNSILSLKSNFRPKEDQFTANDANRFIKDGVIQYIFSRKLEWARKFSVSQGRFDEKAFPSIKMTFYNVFYRFYAEKREPEEQDVFDLFISSAAPYVDVVVTEKFQAEIFRKVKSRDPFLAHLQVETAKYLRPQ